MKIIFLDIDGVLNNTKHNIKMYNKLGHDKYWELMNKDMDIFDNKSLKYLSKIIDYFENKILIVISSTWRLNKKNINKVVEKISKYTKSWNIKFDITGVDKDMIRGNEIEEYLKSHNLLDSEYVILDDDTFDIIGDKYKGKIDFNKHFVWCNNETGFKRKEYKEAMKILRRKWGE